MKSPLHGLVNVIKYPINHQIMKIINSLVTRFEQDQKSVGTKVALQNVIWEVASGLMKNIGVKNIKTTYK